MEDEQLLVHACVFVLHVCASLCVAPVKVCSHCSLVLVRTWRGGNSLGFRMRGVCAKQLRVCVCCIMFRTEFLISHFVLVSDGAVAHELCGCVAGMCIFGAPIERDAKGIKRIADVCLA
jgi:hypothetical protein